jgi:microcystin-dependent protein
MPTCTTITNGATVAITAETLTADFCHTSLQLTHNEFAAKTTINHLGAAFTVGTTVASGDQDKLWMKLDGDSRPLGWYYYDSCNSAWQSFSTTPVGTLNPYAGASAPDGWLLCDGSDVAKLTYVRLNALLGTTYGAATDATLNFKLPDMRGRIPVAADGSAGRMASNDAAGESGGEELHTLTIAEMPDGMYAKNISFQRTDNTNNNNHNPASPRFDTVSGDVNIGGATAMNNMQPYQVVANYIIKT